MDNLYSRPFWPGSELSDGMDNLYYRKTPIMDNLYSILGVLDKLYSRVCPLENGQTLEMTNYIQMDNLYSMSTEAA